MQGNFCVCIPTYCRPTLLLRLIQDIAGQTAPPAELIIVDGDAEGDDVVPILQEAEVPRSIPTYYVPSNHANLPYQRYLGWLMAKRHDLDAILYLDDDLRISDPLAVEKLMEPLLNQEDWIGGTGVIRHGASGAENTNYQPFSKLVSRFGVARALSPGELTPTGIRSIPQPDGDDYAEIHWLHGGVMAFRVKPLEEDCFLNDVFAVYERKIGKGEDTILSRRANSLGKLYISLNSTFEHPETDAPKAYPTAAYQRGYAFAYSRRLINDQYRGFQPPILPDRLALVRSYLGATLLYWSSAILKLGKSDALFALGYVTGAARGLVQRPSAKTLTPEIDWRADAEEAIKNTQTIGELWIM